MQRLKNSEKYRMKFEEKDLKTAIVNMKNMLKDIKKRYKLDKERNRG